MRHGLLRQRQEQPLGPRDVRIMLATVFAANMCDYRMFLRAFYEKTTCADLDRLETMRAGLFGLLSEDNEWTTILLKR
jgi:hypothetical protein